MSQSSFATKIKIDQQGQNLLPVELWERVLSMLHPEQQLELSSLCAMFCSITCPYWIQVVQGRTMERSEKPSLVDALKTFKRFRLEYPTRLFQIRLSPGVHNSGFVKYDGSPLVIGEGNFEGLRLRSWEEQSSSQNWDGLHIQSAEFVAVCGADGVTSVILSHGAEINQSAFEDLDQLTRVLFPPVLERLNTQAFYQCRSLEFVDLPDGLQIIEDGAFSDCSSLRSISLPQTLQEFGWDVFSGCTNLESVTLPKGLQRITRGVFSNCSSLTSVTLPEKLRIIEEEAFYGCSSLTSLTFPEGLKHVGDGAFSGCSSLTSLTLPEGLQRVGKRAFSKCSSLTHVSLPKGLEIGAGAFSECSSLTSINLA